MDKYRKKQFLVIFHPFFEKMSNSTPLRAFTRPSWNLLCWPCWVHYMSELLSYGKHMVTIRKIGEIGTFVRAIKYTEF